jgi:hypothetical protein
MTLSVSRRYTALADEWSGEETDNLQGGTKVLVEECPPTTLYIANPTRTAH